MKRFLVLILAICIAVATASNAEAARKKTAKRPQPDRYASIVVEADTGLVLSEKNADKQLYPASLTKMMTLYMTFDAIQQGKLRKNQRITVSKHAASQDPSKLGLQPGGTIRVEDAILALVTKSANDAAAVLGEAIGGSESRFGVMMTQKARAIGMSRSRFVNASGLHNPSQVSTARDMSTLSRALIRHFPKEYRYFSTNNFTYAGVSHHNHNRLMNSYQGMDGIKTGYVYASGYNLAASAVRNNKRLVGVVFGGRTTQSRNAEMAKILDAGFVNVQTPAIASRIAKLKGQAVAARNAATATTQASAKTTSAQGRKTVAAIPATTSQQVNITQQRVAANGFNAMALVPGEQGDTAEEPNNYVAAASALPYQNGQVAPPKVIRFRPQGVNTQAIMPESVAMAAAPAKTQLASAATPVVSSTASGWSVQVGAFASHSAGMTALNTVRSKLPKHLTTGSQYSIAPLMTNRGMIYRARLAGLGREQATDTCRILKGNCLILATQ